MGPKNGCLTPDREVNINRPTPCNVERFYEKTHYNSLKSVFISQNLINKHARICQNATKPWINPQKLEIMHHLLVRRFQSIPKGLSLDTKQLKWPLMSLHSSQYQNNINLFINVTN